MPDKPSAYYNEIDGFAVKWLRELMSSGLIMDGDIDDRSIEEVQPDEIRGYTRYHFFAGIAGWELALQYAGWPDDRPVWTGSCPCQSLSCAGEGQAEADPRHLWPDFFRLIAEHRPATVFGEQVASPLGREWYSAVRLDFEDIDYQSGASVIPASVIGAPHERKRLWWLANTKGEGRRGWLEQVEKDRPSQKSGRSNEIVGGELAHPDSNGVGRRCVQGFGETESAAQQGSPGPAGKPVVPQRHSITGYWDEYDLVRSRIDGKDRPRKPGLPLLVDGVPDRVGRIRGYGNSIVPQVAALFVMASMEAIDDQ